MCCSLWTPVNALQRVHYNASHVQCVMCTSTLQINANHPQPRWARKLGEVDEKGLRFMRGSEGAESDRKV